MSMISAVMSHYGFMGADFSRRQDMVYMFLRRCKFGVHCIVFDDSGIIFNILSKDTKRVLRHKFLCAEKLSHKIWNIRWKIGNMSHKEKNQIIRREYRNLCQSIGFNVVSYF